MPNLLQVRFDEPHRPVCKSSKPNPGDATITLCAKGEHKGWSNLPLGSVNPSKAFFSENKIQQERLIPKYQ